MTGAPFVATDVQQRLMETVRDGRYRYIGFGGGVRGTKTWGSLSVLLVLCKAFPGSRWCVVRKDLQRLRQTTLPSFEKLRQQYASKFCAPVDGYFEAKCTNGSVILFRGENIDKDPELERFHGYEVNGFLFEEADELQEKTFHKGIERAGAWIVPTGAQPDPLILCTFNPTAAWPKRVFYDPWLEGNLQPPYAFIPTTIADNPHAHESYKTALKDLPPEEYKRFVEGDWTTLTGRYYTSLDRSVHIIPRAQLPDVLPHWWEYWGSFDWGFAHWAVFCAWARDSDGNTYLLDSCWMRREQDDDMAKTIVATMPERCLSEVYAGGDCWSHHNARGGSGDATVDIFDQFGILLIQADDDLVNGGRAVRRALAVRTIERAGQEPFKVSGVYLLDTEGNLRVWEQLGQIMPDPNNVNKPLRVNADAQGRGGNDGADAFRYGLSTKMATPVDRWEEEAKLATRAKLDAVSRQEDVEWEQTLKDAERRARRVGRR